MTDIDDELLALAGEASSDEEEQAEEQIQAEAVAARTSKTKSRAGTKKQSTKKQRAAAESEDEGGRISRSSSVASEDSAPMEESESEADSSNNFIEEGERYPIEGKFMNASDKAQIMSMPEIQREQVLADRAQEVERDRQNRALRNLINAREADQKKQEKKRKAGAADLEENQRKTSRQRTKVGGGKVGETLSGIDNLKKARAEKTDRQRRREEEQTRNHRNNDDADDDDRSYYSRSRSRGSRSPSVVEWDDPKSRSRRSPTPDQRDTEPATLDDINRAKVGRSGFAKVCFYPGFEEAITGCFVRVVIGMEKGQNIYRMALIKGFVEDTAYVIEAANGKQVRTTQFVRAAHGKAERNWPMNTCSDSPITESEWNRYKQTCLAESLPLPTTPRVMAKIRDIHSLLNRTWTEAELQEKLRRSGALLKKSLPLERNRLRDLIRKAREADDEARVATLQAELDSLESQQIKTTPRKPVAPTSMSQQERLAELNRLNRRKNIEEVRQAQIAERRAAKRTEAALARGEVVLEDHSRRVKTRAKFQYDASELEARKLPADNGQDDGAAQRSSLSVAVSASEVVRDGVATGKENGVGGGGITSVVEKLKMASREKSGLPTIRKPVMDDDIIGTMDIGIDDIEI